MTPEQLFASILGVDEDKIYASREGSDQAPCVRFSSKNGSYYKLVMFTLSHAGYMRGICLAVVTDNGAKTLDTWTFPSRRLYSTSTESWWNDSMNRTVDGDHNFKHDMKSFTRRVRACLVFINIIDKQKEE